MRDWKESQRRIKSLERKVQVAVDAGIPAEVLSRRASDSANEERARESMASTRHMIEKDKAAWNLRLYRFDSYPRDRLLQVRVKQTLAWPKAGQCCEDVVCGVPHPLCHHVVLPRFVFSLLLSLSHFSFLVFDFLSHLVCCSLPRMCAWSWGSRTATMWCLRCGR